MNHNRVAPSVTYVPCPECMKLNKISLTRAANAQPTCGACGSLIRLHGAIIDANDRQLEKLIAASPVPVIVDFWAPWCAPCRAFAPTFERVATEDTGSAVFVKLNTETNVQSAQKFGIRGIPTLAVFEAGREKGRISGALPYESFKQMVREVVTGRFTGS